ncbi:MAG: carboxymuconolactone decarboxylase family protein, partial [Rhodobacterales bacterium]|nr:carboxymuconolactone decarboxylase family protein [Rhodobacterales bacterium]MDX5412488.1 carboxymuconolactone decarboxylase family protein [Rhodobacterales bacterium]
MSDAKTPFELMMQQAQEMVKAFNPAMSSFDP